MPLTRCTSRSPATPVPYSFQQRQRAKILGLNATFGTVACHVSQSRFCGERSGGGGYSQAPLGSLRPKEPSTIMRSPNAPCATNSRAFARSAELTPLRSDLDYADSLFRGRNHLDTISRAVRHRLLAIDILAR